MIFNAMYMNYKHDLNSVNKIKSGTFKFHIFVDNMFHCLTIIVLMLTVHSLVLFWDESSKII
jgi:hypothetical protein